MGKIDPRIDDYIAKAKDFAGPVLIHIRNLVHTACPEVEETIKWGFPHFDYKGPLCHMAAFKAHCAFGFWKAAILPDPDQILAESNAMSNFGRITSLAGLPSDEVMLKYLLEAVRLNDEGIKLPPKPKPDPNAVPDIPADFSEALRKNKPALDTFNGFSPSNKREYLEWIGEAKTETTRDKRIATALEWMTEGKPRNWKYMQKSRKS